LKGTVERQVLESHFKSRHKWHKGKRTVRMTIDGVRGGKGHGLHSKTTGGGRGNELQAYKRTKGSPKLMTGNRKIAARVQNEHHQKIGGQKGENVQG